MSAGEKLSLWMTIGLLGLFLGGAIMGMAWPSEVPCTIYDSDCEGVKQTGSMTVVGFGALLAGVGQVFTLMACIGFGVKHGTLAAREADPSKR